MPSAAPIERLDCCLASRRLSLVDGDEPASRCASPAARSASASYRLRVRPLGRVPCSASSSSRARDRFGACRLRAQRSTASARSGSTRGRSVSRTLLRPLETQVFAGNQVAREQGRGDRVRRHAAVRARRPRAADQLARERAARRAVGERVPPRAERRRHPLPRHVRRGAAGADGTLDRAVRGAAALADALPAATRTASAWSPSAAALNWLLPGDRASSQLYRIVDALLDTRDRPELRLEGDRRDPARGRCRRRRSCSRSRRCSTSARSARSLDLRARGFDLAIVESRRCRSSQPGRAASSTRSRYGIWKLRRDALRAPVRARRRAGRRVARRAMPLAAALEEVRAFRRYAGPARASGWRRAVGRDARRRRARAHRCAPTGSGRSWARRSRRALVLVARARAAERGRLSPGRSRSRVPNTLRCSPSGQGSIDGWAPLVRGRPRCLCRSSRTGRSSRGAAARRAKG